MTNGQNYDSDSVLRINNVKLLLLISERIVKGKSNKMSVERLWSRGYPLGSHQIANRSPCELPFRHFEFCHINVAIVLCHYTIVVVAAAVSAAVSFNISFSLHWRHSLLFITNSLFTPPTWDKTVLSCPCQWCEQNCRQDKTVLSCFDRVSNF